MACAPADATRLAADARKRLLQGFILFPLVKAAGYSTTRSAFAV
jgi:hypothetical protein